MSDPPASPSRIPELDLRDGAMHRLTRVASACLTPHLATDPSSALLAHMTIRERVARGLQPPERADVVAERNAMLATWPFVGSSPAPPSLQRLRRLVQVERLMAKPTADELRIAFIKRVLGGTPETEAALHETSEWWKSHRPLRQTRPRRTDENDTQSRKEDLAWHNKLNGDPSSVLSLLRFFDRVAQCRTFIHLNAQPRELTRFLARIGRSHDFSSVDHEDYIELVSGALLRSHGNDGFRFDGSVVTTSSGRATIRDAAALKLTLAVLRWLYEPRGDGHTCPMARLPVRMLESELSRAVTVVS